ncbi:MAG: polysaccharide deacetylase family protein [Candidatus Omnitrophica bacterium]|nr:polysaccharide deacetylase family protein [Candidatus Omnitrophota bacterium]
MAILRTVLSDITYHARRLTPGDGEGLRILMYHRVTDAHPGNRLCVPVARFADQMRWLAEQGYRTISFAEAVELVRGQGAGGGRRGNSRQAESAAFPRPAPRAPRPKLIVLTFDDGFEDNFLYAYRALAQYGFTGCFFVPSAFIASGQTGHEAVDQPMSWAQLSELAREGHEVGAHSISHAKLTHIDPVQMREEVRGSKEAIEQGLQQPVRFFCYPSGDYNAAVKQAVRDSGYDGACTVEPGANRSGADPFALTRTEISAFDSLWDFEKKIAGAFDWMHRVVQWTKR